MPETCNHIHIETGTLNNNILHTIRYLINCTHTHTHTFTHSQDLHDTCTCTPKYVYNISYYQYNKDSIYYTSNWLFSRVCIHVHV